MEITKREPLTTEQRKAIVAEAMTWVGTPYHHMADVKGHGVDCAMILVRIYCGLGIAPLFDPRPYPQQWFLHRSEEKYKLWIEKYCDQVESAQSGDIGLFRYGRCAAHGAIIIDENYMVHAFAPSGRVEYIERRAFTKEIDSIWTPRNI
jgi:cell wall-associated NlpC family hydrolase